MFICPILLPFKKFFFLLLLGFGLGGCSHSWMGSGSSFPSCNASVLVIWLNLSMLLILLIYFNERDSVVVRKGYGGQDPA